MKIFKYDYFIWRGEGQGIISAETEEKAITIIEATPYYKSNKKKNMMFTIEEITFDEEKIIDMSWEE